MLNNFSTRNLKTLWTVSYYNDYGDSSDDLFNFEELSSTLTLLSQTQTSSWEGGTKISGKTGETYYKAVVTHVDDTYGVDGRIEEILSGFQFYTEIVLENYGGVESVNFKKNWK